MSTFKMTMGKTSFIFLSAELLTLHRAVLISDEKVLVNISNCPNFFCLKFLNVYNLKLPKYLQYCINLLSSFKTVSFLYRMNSSLDIGQDTKNLKNYPLMDNMYTATSIRDVRDPVQIWALQKNQ